MHTNTTKCICYPIRYPSSFITLAECTIFHGCYDPLPPLRSPCLSEWCIAEEVTCWCITNPLEKDVIPAQKSCSFEWFVNLFLGFENHCIDNGYDVKIRPMRYEPTNHTAKWRVAHLFSCSANELPTVTRVVPPESQLIHITRQPANLFSPAMTSASNEKELKSIASEEVAQHNSEESCWVIVGNASNGTFS